MRFTVASLLLLPSISAQQQQQHQQQSLLRGSLQSAVDNLSSTCLGIKDRSTCSATTDEAGEPCVWCKCAAVPSVCVSEKQSKLLPPGVFACDADGTDDGSTGHERREEPAVPPPILEATAEDGPAERRTYVLDD